MTTPPNQHHHLPLPLPLPPASSTINSPLHPRPRPITLPQGYLPANPHSTATGTSSSHAPNTNTPTQPSTTPHIPSSLGPNRASGSGLTAATSRNCSASAPTTPTRKNALPVNNGGSCSGTAYPTPPPPIPSPVSPLRKLQLQQLQETAVLEGGEWGEEVVRIGQVRGSNTCVPVRVASDSFPPGTSSPAAHWYNIPSPAQMSPNRLLPEEVVKMHTNRRISGEYSPRPMSSHSRGRRSVDLDQYGRRVSVEHSRSGWGGEYLPSGRASGEYSRSRSRRGSVDVFERVSGEGAGDGKGDEHIVHGTWKGGRFRPPWDMLTTVGSVGDGDEGEDEGREGRRRERGGVMGEMDMGEGMRIRGTCGREEVRRGSYGVVERKELSRPTTGGRIRGYTLPTMGEKRFFSPIMEAVGSDLQDGSMVVPPSILQQQISIQPLTSTAHSPATLLQAQAFQVVTSAPYTPIKSQVASLHSGNSDLDTTPAKIDTDEEDTSPISHLPTSPPTTYKAQLLLTLLAEHYMDTLHPELAIYIYSKLLLPPNFSIDPITIHPPLPSDSYPPSPGPCPAATASTLFNLGQFHLQLHHSHSALRAFQHAVILDPYEIASHVQIGFVSYLLTRYRAAEQGYRDALHAMREGVGEVRYGVLGLDVIVKREVVERSMVVCARLAWIEEELGRTGCLPRPEGDSGGGDANGEERGVWGIATAKIFRVREEKKRNLGVKRYFSQGKVVARARGGVEGTGLREGVGVGRATGIAGLFGAGKVVGREVEVEVEEEDGGRGLERIKSESGISSSWGSWGMRGPGREKEKEKEREREGSAGRRVSFDAVIGRLSGGVYN